MENTRRRTKNAMMNTFLQTPGRRCFRSSSYLVQVQRGIDNPPSVVSREQFHPVGAPRQGCDAVFVNPSDVKSPELGGNRQSHQRKEGSARAGALGTRWTEPSHFWGSRVPFAHVPSKPRGQPGIARRNSSRHMCFLRVLPEPTCYLVTEHAVGAFLAIAVQADEGSHSKPWGLATAVRDAEPVGSPACSSRAATTPAGRRRPARRLCLRPPGHRSSSAASPP